jgi:hypothetical protein
LLQREVCALRDSKHQSLGVSPKCVGQWSKQRMKFCTGGADSGICLQVSLLSDPTLWEG